MGRGRRRRSTVHGVLVVDKPRGPTSHDVVSQVRRALGTRVVGHAGTLDPMATGVLVIAVGEATKLVPYLTADDKRYVATVKLGVKTDTLDAMGEVVDTAPIPVRDRPGWQALAEGFLGPHAQQVPRVSAVRVGGQRLHARARRGEQFDAPTREVVARALTITEASAEELEVQVWCHKGFYVRAWARDLARAGGTVGHLTRLQRTASGRFGLDEAVDSGLIAEAKHDDAARASLHDRMLTLSEACGRVLPVVHVSEDAARDVYHGRPIGVASCDAPPDEGPLALLDRGGVALAVARREGERVLVVRGFRCDPSGADEPGLAGATQGQDRASQG